MIRFTPENFFIFLCYSNFIHIFGESLKSNKNWYILVFESGGRGVGKGEETVITDVLVILSTHQK